MAASYSTSIKPTYTKIASQTLGSVSSATLSNIPQNYTDLVLVIYAQRGTSGAGGAGNITVNGDGSSIYSTSMLYGDSGGALSYRWTGQSNLPALFTAGDSTASPSILHFQNYSNGTTYKTILAKFGWSGTNSRVATSVGLYRSTSPITSITISSAEALASGATLILYGIECAKTPKADGGNSVYTDGTYWYHVFNTSGTLNVRTAMSVDYLVVAGGGGGGQLLGGGGGAGGMRCTVTGTGGSGSLESALSVVPQQYAVTVGGGGAAGNASPNPNQAPNGSNSTFGSITATGGGGGGAATTDVTQVGANGGSGGGGAGRTGVVGGSASPSGQGFGGGTANGQWGSTEIAGGGGGGASAVGGNASQPNGGAGGNGRATSISGYSVTYAGGGGGFGSGYPSGAGAGPGGTGGGGTGAKGYNSITNATAGTANTGGGGGGGHLNYGLAAAGGSGIVIVRYAV